MLDLIVAPSRNLARVLVSAHALAGVLLGLTDLPMAWKIAALPLFLASLVLALRRHAWRLSPSSVVGLQLDDEGKAICHCRNGEHYDGVLLGSSFVAPWLTVLNLRPEGRCRSVSLVILPDAVPVDDFRRLRVLLRWKYSQAKPG